MQEKVFQDVPLLDRYALSHTWWGCAITCSRFITAAAAVHVHEPMGLHPFVVETMH